MANDTTVLGNAPGKEGAGKGNNKGRHPEPGLVRIHGLWVGSLDRNPFPIRTPLFRLLLVVATEPKKLSFPIYLRFRRPRIPNTRFKEE